MIIRIISLATRGRSIDVRGRLAISVPTAIICFRLSDAALAQAVVATLIRWSLINLMFKYLLVDHALPGDVA
jgi:hypothetical protein